MEPKDVLVVEDNDMMRRLITAVLERNADLRVQEARTGAEGLSLVADNAPAAIVLDMMLPDMDGLRFIDALQKSAPSLPPIVAITGATQSVISDAIIRSSSREAVHAVLRKPFDNGELLTIVSLCATGTTPVLES